MLRTSAAYEAFNAQNIVTFFGDRVVQDRLTLLARFGQSSSVRFVETHIKIAWRSQLSSLRDAVHLLPLASVKLEMVPVAGLHKTSVDDTRHVDWCRLTFFLVRFLFEAFG